jgi:hypothetical protein
MYFVELGSVRILKKIDSGPIHVCFFEIFITPEAIQVSISDPGSTEKRSRDDNGINQSSRFKSRMRRM